jgi:hypothetical protein
VANSASPLKLRLGRVTDEVSARVNLRGMPQPPGSLAIVECSTALCCASLKRWRRAAPGTLGMHSVALSYGPI